MAEHRYNPQEIESRWQSVWASERTWEVSNENEAEGRGEQRPAGAQAPRSYVLEMLPYPSGSLTSAI
jgi:leucyl-tRNA synthetase